MVGDTSVISLLVIAAGIIGVGWTIVRSIQVHLRLREEAREHEAKIIRHWLKDEREINMAYAIVGMHEPDPPQRDYLPEHTHNFADPLDRARMNDALFIHHLELALEDK